MKNALIQLILIQLILKWACLHKWTLPYSTDVKRDGKIVAHRMLYCCEKCGKFKMIKIG